MTIPQESTPKVASSYQKPASQVPVNDLNGSRLFGEIVMESRAASSLNG